MTEGHVPSKEELKAYLREHRNWGRWPDDPEAGAANLITPEKKAAAARLVRTGRSVSLSRPWPIEPTPENPDPASLYVMSVGDKTGGGALDYMSVAYHGHSVTHVDSLCHFWDEDGMWGGHDPTEAIVYDGVKHGSVDAWYAGLMTRGVLLDVPKHRGQPYVTHDQPVHGWELQEIAEAEGLELRPGDAVMVYSGREVYASENHGTWGGPWDKPGLHPSCLTFIRDNDVAVLGWDMLEAAPPHYGTDVTVHAAISSFGVVLLDNALLEPLADACAEEDRYEFMLTINPLVVPGGTGSPVNPIAVF